MTPEPTADSAEIVERHRRRARSTTTGIEIHVPRPSPRSSAGGAGTRTQAGQAYRPMVIVVTDEVGDDETRLEEAIERRQQGQGAGLRARLAGDLRPGRGLHGLHRPQDQAASSTTCPSARGPRAPCSSRSACRSGTTARSTTSSTPGSARTPSAAWPAPPAGSTSSPGWAGRPDGVRPGRDAGVQARLGQPRPVRGGRRQAPDPPGRARGGADHPAAAARAAHA